MTAGNLRFLGADSSDQWEIVRTRPHGLVARVLGTMRAIGLEQVLASRPSRERELAKAIIAARVFDPRSKLATARGLGEQTEFSTLGEVVALEATNEDDLYTVMDWLLASRRRIEKKLAVRHLSDGCLVLQDDTSSWYTGRHWSLAQFGHDRHGKGRFPLVLYGLLCNENGCPVATDVFAGNRGDSETLAVHVRKLWRPFGLRRVIVVGDNDTMTEARIRENPASLGGLSWITPLRSPAIRRPVEAGAVQQSLFDEYHLADVESPDYPNERLIACRNPLLPDERTRKREELLQATQMLVEKIRAATRRPKRALRAKVKIGLRVGRVVNLFKMAKQSQLRITETSFSYRRLQERIASEAARVHPA